MPKLHSTGLSPMVKRVSHLLLISSMALALLALTSNRRLNAQECTVAHDVVKDDVVPCTGVLWTLGATEDALTLKAVAFPKLQVDFEHLKELRILDQQRHAETIQACNGELRETRDLLNETMGLVRVPWYRQPVIVAGISFVTGVATTILIVRSL